MKKLTFKNKFGYFLGDFANCMTFAMSSSFLLKFYTDVLGITALAAGTLFLVARLWDAFNDPIMGAITDKIFVARLRKHEGKDVDKFKPFLLYGSWIVVAAAIVMFIAPKGLGPGARLVWAYATYIIWGIAYTFVNIPYGSLASVMTQDPAERASLSVARGLGGTVGNIVPSIIVPIVLGFFTKDQAGRGYLISMVIMGVLGIIGYLITYNTVEENIKTPVTQNRDKVKFVEFFKVLGKNRPFIAVCLSSLTMLFGMMTNRAMALYYFEENLNNIQAMGIATVMGMLPGLLIAPFLSKLVEKYSLKSVITISALLSGISFGILMFLPDTLPVYIIGTLLANLFMNAPMTLVWAMVSDCIDYNQYLSGDRQEGVIYGSYSFIRKLGQALAGFLSGAGLTLIGYNAETVGQSERTLFGIKFLTLGFPAIGMILAFLCFLLIWNITPEKQKEVLEQINK